MAPARVVTVFVLALLVGSTSAASASDARGTTTIDLGGGAMKVLRAQGATLAARSPARIVRGELRLPVREGLVASTATINLGGSLTLRRGKRSLRIERLQARLGSGVRIVGTAKDTRLTLFTAARRSTLDAANGTASLRNAQLKMTQTAATLIKRSLKLRRLPIGGIGRATVDALVTATAKAPTAGAPSGSPGAPPQSAPISDEPPLLARPASAVNVSAATVTWHVRDSWIRYISAGSGSSPLGGAVAGAAITPAQHPCPDSPGSAPALVYSYSLPFVRGWHDPVSGQTALYTSGGVRFLFPAHGIDLEVNDLEIELNGASSRVIARFDGRQSTSPGNKRAVLVDLANAGPSPGQTATVRGTLPTGGSLDVFAGFYPAHAGFGCVTVSYAA
jgi:hypothetical protein